MNYHVVFDAGQTGSGIAVYWLAPLASLIAALIGWALFRSGDPKEATKGKFFLLIPLSGLHFHCCY